MSEATPAVELRIADNAAEASAGLLFLTSVLEKLKNIVSGGLNLDKTADGLEKLNRAITSAVPESSVKMLERMADAIEKLNGSGAIEVSVQGVDTGAISAINDTVTAQTADNFNAVAEAANDYISAGNTVAEATEGINDAVRETLPLMKQTEDTAHNMADGIRDTKDAMGEAGEETETFKSRLKDLLSGIESTRRSHNGLLSSFARIAKYRMIRWVIKQITDGFAEGVKNVREYSKAIGGSFSTAMDTADNALLKMKNSIGAAVAPVLEALIPVLQTVVNWVITAVNWVNQLLSLLSGKSSWTKAVDASAKSLDDVGKNARGAGGDIKNLLADFDELNIIQSKSGGGGSGSGLTDTTAYQKMFTQVYQFEGRIRKVADFIRKNMDEIRNIAILAGTAIAAWKISSAMTGFLSTLTGLIAAGAIIALEFQLSSTLTDEYLDTGNPGWLIADAIQTAVGTGLAAILVKKFLGGNAMAWTIPLSLTVSAIAGIRAILGKKDVSALDKKTVTAALENAAKIGTAVGYGLFKLGTVGHAVALLGGAGAALITFGAIIGIKAVAVAAENKDFENEEYLTARLESSIAMGSGGALAAAAAGYGQMGMITSATSAGAGAFLLTFGVMTGIAAIAEAARGGETKATIAKKAVASLEMALGTTLTTASVFGMTVGTIAGSAVGIIGFGIMVAATVYLEAQSKDAVHWGSLHPPTEAIEQFVKDQMLPISPEVTISLIENTITGIETVKANIKNKVANLKVNVTKLKFNIDKQGAIKDIEEQIWGNAENGTTGLLDEVSQYSKENQTLIEASVSLVPVITETGEDISQKIATAGTTGWTGIETWFKEKGNALATAMKGGIVEGYDGTAEDIVAKLTEEISDASLALTMSQTSGAMYGYMIDNLSQLDQGSFNEAVNVYNNALAQQEQVYRRAYLQTIESYYTMADFYKRTGNKDMAETMYAAAEQYKNAMDSSIASAMTEYEAMGKQLLTEWLNQYVGNGLNFDDWGANKGFGNMVVNAFADNGQDFRNALQSVIESEFNIPVSVLELLDLTGWSLLTDDVQENVRKAFEQYDGFIPEDVREFLFGKNNGTEINGIDWVPYGEYITEQYKKTAELKSEVQSIGEMNVTAKPLDMSAVNSSIDDTSNRLLYLRELYYSIPFFSRNDAPALRNVGSNSRFNIRTYAAGGFPEKGSMFIAREAGPEMVGSINGKTAVANNDQIVAGVASGVAAGQAEQNSLLRQQNEYLRALLNKESTVKIEPSSAWGKFNRRSEAMYARNAGY